jgi:hypothetical protein
LCAAGFFALSYFCTLLPNTALALCGISKTVLPDGQIALVGRKLADTIAPLPRHNMPLGI